MATTDKHADALPGGIGHDHDTKHWPFMALNGAACFTLCAWWLAHSDASVRASSLAGLSLPLAWSVSSKFRSWLARIFTSALATLGATVVLSATGTWLFPDAHAREFADTKVAGLSPVDATPALATIQDRAPFTEPAIYDGGPMLNIKSDGWLSIEVPFDVRAHADEWVCASGVAPSSGSLIAFRAQLPTGVVSLESEIVEAKASAVGCGPSGSSARIAHHAGRAPMPYQLIAFPASDGVLLQAGESLRVRAHVVNPLDHEISGRATLDANLVPTTDHEVNVALLSADIPSLPLDSFATVALSCTGAIGRIFAVEPFGLVYATHHNLSAWRSNVRDVIVDQPFSATNVRTDMVRERGSVENLRLECTFATTGHETGTPSDVCAAYVYYVGPPRARLTCSLGNITTETGQPGSGDRAMERQADDVR